VPRGALAVFNAGRQTLHVDRQRHKAQFPTPRKRAAECRQMAERAPNLRVQGILLDIARAWTRLALEAEQWSETNRPTLRLTKAPCKDSLLRSGFGAVRRGARRRG
jgi:hypothetical protein